MSSEIFNSEIFKSQVPGRMTQSPRNRTTVVPATAPETWPAGHQKLPVPNGVLEDA